MSDRPDITAQLDQMGATMACFATVVAQYHKALIDHGVPADLAGEIALQWQGIYFASCYGVAYRADG